VIKALLIGCGNIGAGYDFNDPSKVWTHAKAYSLRNDIELSIFDEDLAKAQQTAKKYNAILVESMHDQDYNKYEIISITTPTTTHYKFLEKVIESKVPVVICEKPIANEATQLEQLEQLYKSGHSKILINYIRRFQPGYKETKERILECSKGQSLQGVIIKYKRGFLNNASHAIDLLEYIFETAFDFEKFHSSASVFDAFDYDPTITATCLFHEVPVNFAGFANISYAVFEIELFFSSCKVVICHSGNEVRYYYDDKGNWNEHLGERQTALLDSYMVPVIDRAVDLYNGNGEDNFMSSLRLNKAVLKTIEPLKIKSNATISN
jgi:GR25 family glycosyltransferase involved in LPS biosynthesis